TGLADENQLARSVADTSLFRVHLPRAPNGTYAAIRASDGVHFFVSYETVLGTSNGLIISAAVPRAAALADFRRDFFADAAQSGLALCFVLIGGGLLVRSLRRRERLEA